MTDTQKCPLCGKAKHVRVNGPRDFTCMDCKMDFDGVDDGDVGYQRPERIASRREEFQLRAKRRLRGKSR